MIKGGSDAYPGLVPPPHQSMSEIGVRTHEETDERRASSRIRSTKRDQSAPCPSQTLLWALLVSLLAAGGGPWGALVRALIPTSEHCRKENRDLCSSNAHRLATELPGLLRFHLQPAESQSA